MHPPTTEAPGYSALDSGCSDPLADSRVETIPTFEPQEEAILQGVLLAARVTPLGVGVVEAAVLGAIARLARLATQWPTDASALEERVADYRFFALEFHGGGSQLLSIRIWCEPTADLLFEVGTDRPAGRAVQTAPARLASTLQGRGFQLAGSSGRYTKHVPNPRTSDDARRVAHELLALLRVLGYDGTTALSYKLRQGTHLKRAHVARELTRQTVFALLKVWGLHATQHEDGSTAFRAQSHGFDFTLELASPDSESPDHFKELHGHASIPVPTARLKPLLAEINGKTWLLKAYALGDGRAPSTGIRITFGLSVAGGVTLEHLKCQLFDWLGHINQLMLSLRPPAAGLARELDADALLPKMLH